MLLTIILAGALIGADQLIKWLVATNLKPDGAVTVIPGVVEFRYYENTGAAFSILEGKQGFLIVFTAIALLAVAWYLFFRRPKGKLEYIAVLMIFAGGVGNLIDRIANRYVVDYINLLFMRFAIFNFADCLVTVGFALLVVAVLRAELKERKAAKEKAALAVQGQESAAAKAEDADTAPKDDESKQAAAADEEQLAEGTDGQG